MRFQKAIKITAKSIYWNYNVTVTWVHYHCCVRLDTDMFLFNSVDFIENKMIFKENKRLFFTIIIWGYYLFFKLFRYRLEVGVLCSLWSCTCVKETKKYSINDWLKRNVSIYTCINYDSLKSVSFRYNFLLRLIHTCFMINNYAKGHLGCNRW